MPDEWYRNTNWDESTSQRFEQKLSRARRKESYLRIQASILAESHPNVALDLLARYFALPDDFEHAQAFVDQARAYQTLGQIEQAVKSYEAALAREAEFPNYLTNAYLQLPALIATEGLSERYDQALTILKQHQPRLTFPVDHFLWHASFALILSATGAYESAKGHAKLALEAAARQESGFRYHPNVGLVEDKYQQLVHRLTTLVRT
jgi:tetratricopeptide (TPR) repeat protein